MNDNAKFIHQGLPLAIGSLPFSDAEFAGAKIMQYFPRSPSCPELPRRDFKESMGFIQTEGLPGMTVDAERRRIYMDTAKDLSAEMEDFYERFLADDLSSFAMTADYAAGLNAMIERIARCRPTGLEVLKGQLSGPTTFGLIIKDGTGKAILYNDQMMDVLLKGTVMKAKWMIERFGSLGLEAIIFFDEPMLQSIGSPTVPIDRDKAVGYLNEVVDAVECLTGAHCCGNTDWSILMESNVKIIAFDAYHYAETMALYPKPLQTFLDMGGAIAWGIVPASVEAAGESVTSLTKRLNDAFELVAKSGIDKRQLEATALVTPSCGLGSLTPELAERIMALTGDVSVWLRERS